MRDRRGTRGDFRATSMRASLGLVGNGVRGLIDSSDSSSVSVLETFDV
jgi:hypothetical protein